MSKNEIHVSDIGTVFEATIKDDETVVDISSALVTKNLIFKNAAGTSKTKAGSFTTDGTDGLLRYVTVADDLDDAGKWQVQANIVLTTGTWSSSIYKFDVFANL